MAREQFNDLLWFLAVAEERSFTRAAARLGISQSTLSHTIRRLETRMGVLLLNRTTRNVAPTGAGERLQLSLSPRIAEIESEMATIMSWRDRPAGRVRITLSDHALHTIVWPKLREVLIGYPDIRVEFSVDSAFRNIVDSGFDAGIRLGESVEQDMIAVRIGPDWRLVAVASPDYLAARGTPMHPKELITHTCINIRQIAAGGLYAWEFEKGGEDLRVRVGHLGHHPEHLARLSRGQLFHLGAFLRVQECQEHRHGGAGIMGGAVGHPADPLVSLMRPVVQPAIRHRGG